MTEKQEQYHQADIQAAAQLMLGEANRRGWGHLVPQIFGELNEKLTVKLPEVTRVDKIIAGLFQFPAPEGSEAWTTREGAAWVNDKLAEIRAASPVPGLSFTDVGPYGWDRVNGRYEFADSGLRDAPQPASVRRITTASDEHKADMKTFADTLWRHKDLQGWCGEFEQSIPGINQKLRVPLPDPEPTVKVMVAVQYRFDWEYDPNKSKRDNERAVRDHIMNMPLEERKALLVEKIDSIDQSWYDASFRAKQYSSTNAHNIDDDLF